MSFSDKYLPTPRVGNGFSALVCLVSIHVVTGPGAGPSPPPHHGLTSAKVSRAVASLVWDSGVRLMRWLCHHLIYPYQTGVRGPLCRKCCNPAAALCAPRGQLSSSQTPGLQAQLPGLTAQDSSSSGPGDTSSSEGSLCSLDASSIVRFCALSPVYSSL